MNKIVTILILTVFSSLGYSQNKPIEVTYKKLQARAKNYIGKKVVLNAHIRGYHAKRRTLAAYFDESMASDTSFPCIYNSNDMVCFFIPEGKNKLEDYLIDEIQSGKVYKAKVLVKVLNEKAVEVEEIRFCNSTTNSCEPYAKVVQ